jgi:cytochrome c oxidase subunit 1
VATIGAFIIAVGILVFMWNVLQSTLQYRRERKIADPDPWDARSLEWMLPSPVPAHNFDEIPTVGTLDEFWHRKYGEDEQGRAVRIAPTADVVQKGDAQGVHLPSPSYWPIVLAFGLPVIAYGIIYNLGLSFVGTLIVIAAIYGWAMEPSSEPHEPGADHGDAHPSGDGAGDAAEPADAGEPSEAADTSEADDTSDTAEVGEPSEAEEVAPVG